MACQRQQFVSRPQRAEERACNCVRPAVELWAHQRRLCAHLRMRGAALRWWQTLAALQLGAGGWTFPGRLTEAVGTGDEQRWY